MRIKQQFTGLFFAALVAAPLFLMMLLGLQAMPRVAHASPGQPGPYGTRLNHGYFTGNEEDWGIVVVPGGVHSNSTNELVSTIRSLYASSDPQKKTGAAFIMNTMMGKKTPGDRTLNPTQVDDWEDNYVRNPDVVINFNENYTFCYNSYWQESVRDDAWYNRNGGSSCWDPSDFIDGVRVGASITFREKGTGKFLYAIRRACGNPVGQLNMPGLPRRNFNMNAVIKTEVNDASSSNAEPGDKVEFIYEVSNSNLGTANGITCTTKKHDSSGYRPQPPATDAGTGSGPNIGCPSTFNKGALYRYTETIPSAPASGTICRSLHVSPDTPAGGTASIVACVWVYAKPYFRVYGGDVEAGANFTPACGVPAGAGTIQAYNKGAAGNYAGSGAEGAVVAYGSVTEFVSAAMRNSGTPRTPKGLTFANNSVAAYGGNFGAGSCIPNYWSLSASPGATVYPSGWPASPTNIAAAAASPNVTAGPSIVNFAPGAKKDIFVDGDVIINGDIAYTGNWTIDLANNTIPSFRLIAHGNIYIQNNVRRLDGTYIALPILNGTKGLIYTCSFGAAPPSQEQMAHDCGIQLSVNGAFIAKGVKLLRTANTLRSAGAAETSAATKAAEVFTYSPEVWLAKPQFRFQDEPDYDAITTLPPVL